MTMASPGKGPAIQLRDSKEQTLTMEQATQLVQEKRRGSRLEPQTLTNACTHTKEGFSH